MRDLKKDFPILERKINGKRLVYLDNAAVTQISRQVVERMTEFEYNHRANVSRGLHTLGEEATSMYENARKNVADFIGANSPAEIVFIKNATEGINIVAQSWATKNLKKDDIILLTEAEHSSNLIPWQKIAKITGAKLAYFLLNKDGAIDYRNINVDYKKVKLVSITHISNVLGYKNNILEISKYIKKQVIKAKGNKNKSDCDFYPKILVDATHSVSLEEINVKKMGVDFLVFSGHKMYGPMGVGVLWVNKANFDHIDTFFTGGGMVKELISEHNASFKEMPSFLEAGTPNVTCAIGLAAACDYIRNIGFKKITKIYDDLMEYGIKNLMKIEGVEIYGTSDYRKRAKVISFNVKSIPSHDLATVLDQQGVEIRSGQHCVLMWHKKMGVKTTARVSFGIYNTIKDIDMLINAIKIAQKTFL